MAISRPSHNHHLSPHHDHWLLLVTRLSIPTLVSISYRSPAHRIASPLLSLNLHFAFSSFGAYTAARDHPTYPPTSITPPSTTSIMRSGVWVFFMDILTTILYPPPFLEFTALIVCVCTIVVDMHGSIFFFFFVI